MFPELPLYNMIRGTLFIEELQGNNMVNVQKSQILLCGFGSCHWNALENKVLNIKFPQFKITDKPIDVFVGMSLY